MTSVVLGAVGPTSARVGILAAEAGEVTVSDGGSGRQLVVAVCEAGVPLVVELSGLLAGSRNSIEVSPRKASGEGERSRLSFWTTGGAPEALSVLAVNHDAADRQEVVLAPPPDAALTLHFGALQFGAQAHVRAARFLARAAQLSVDEVAAFEAGLFSDVRRQYQSLWNNPRSRRCFTTTSSMLLHHDPVAAAESDSAFLARRVVRRAAVEFFDRLETPAPGHGSDGAEAQRSAHLLIALKSAHALMLEEYEMGVASALQTASGDTSELAAELRRSMVELAAQIGKAQSALLAASEVHASHSFRTLGAVGVLKIDSNRVAAGGFLSEQPIRIDKIDPVLVQARTMMSLVVVAPAGSPSEAVADLVARWRSDDPRREVVFISHRETFRSRRRKEASLSRADFLVEAKFGPAGLRSPPTHAAKSAHERPALIFGPMVSTTSPTSAVLLIETDKAATVRCTLTESGGALCQLRECQPRVPRTFVFHNLTPNTAYRISFTGVEYGEGHRDLLFRCREDVSQCCFSEGPLSDRREEAPAAVPLCQMARLHLDGVEVNQLNKMLESSQISRRRPQKERLLRDARALLSGKLRAFLSANPGDFHLAEAEAQGLSTLGRGLVEAVRGEYVSPLTRLGATFFLHITDSEHGADECSSLPHVTASKIVVLSFHDVSENPHAETVLNSVFSWVAAEVGRTAEIVHARGPPLLFFHETHKGYLKARPPDSGPGRDAPPPGSSSFRVGELITAVAVAVS